MFNLNEQLNNQDNKRQYRYLLLDMLGTTSELSSLYIKSLKDNLPSQDIAVIKRPELLHDLASCPHLVCLGKPNQDVNTSLLSASLWQIEEDRLVTKQYVCAWIVSELDIDELADNLLQIGESLGIFCAMRFNPFYEPFRLQLLQDMSKNDAQWIGKLFPSGLTYYYIDHNQEYRTIVSQSGELMSFIHQDMITIQKEAAILFRLYVTWYDINEKQGDTMKNDAVYHIARYYIIANNIGLTNHEDKFIFVLLSMKYGDLSKRKIIRDIISESDAGELASNLSKIDIDNALTDNCTTIE